MAAAPDGSLRKPILPRLSGGQAVAPSVSVIGSGPPLCRLVAVHRDGTDGNAYSLCGDLVDIGRSEGQLNFGEDRFLAPRHARLERRGGGVVVVSLDSANGVYARTRVAEPTPIVDGEQLLLGKEVLRFELLEPEERDLTPAMQHGVRLFGSPVRSPWGRMRQIILSGITRDVYHLVSPEIIVGREEGDIRFPDDEFMSRRHARLSYLDGRATIVDLESSNGTFVRLRGERTLRPSDLLRMGDQLFRFEPKT
jgi:pSer/pThr/pTyr-binding forkhead associated (FHA) protein